MKSFVSTSTSRPETLFCTLERFNLKHAPLPSTSPVEVVSLLTLGMRYALTRVARTPYQRSERQVADAWSWSQPGACSNEILSARVLRHGTSTQHVGAFDIAVVAAGAAAFQCSVILCLRYEHVVGTTNGAPVHAEAWPNDDCEFSGLVPRERAFFGHAWSSDGSLAARRPCGAAVSARQTLPSAQSSCSTASARRCLSVPVT